MARRAFSLCFFLLFAASICVAQRPGGQPTAPPNSTGRGSAGPFGGTSRTADLVVHIVYPNDHPAGDNIAVVLEAATGGVVAQAFTNSEGQATFHDVAPGSYTIKVKGLDVKDTQSDILNLQGFESFRTEYIHVQPLDTDDATAVKSTQGSISAAALNVPPKARKEFDKGTEAYAKGDYKKAQESFQKAIDLYPKYAMAFNNLAAIYMKSGNKARALELWTKALDADGNLVTANANMARVHMVDNDYAAAIPFLQKALSVDPNSGENLLLMSEAQLMAGNFDQALQYARKVQASDGHERLELSRIVAGRSLEAQNRLDLARAEYQALINEAPSSHEAAEARASLSRLESTAKKQ